MADGKISLPYGQFLGCEKGEDGLPKSVESEAEIVRMIFRLFMEGKTPSAIAKQLGSQGIPSPAGKRHGRWARFEHEKLNEEPAYSNEVVKNRVKLCEKFIAAVKKCKLPVLTELWWYYEYQFLDNKNIQYVPSIRDMED